MEVLFFQINGSQLGLITLFYANSTLSVKIVEKGNDQCATISCCLNIHAQVG